MTSNLMLFSILLLAPTPGGGEAAAPEGGLSPQGSVLFFPRPVSREVQKLVRRK